MIFVRMVCPACGARGRRWIVAKPHTTATCRLCSSELRRATRADEEIVLAKYWGADA